MRRLLIFLFILAFSFSLVFSQGGSTRFVAVETAEVKSSTGFFSQDLGTLRLGDTVTALRESGRWTEVRAGNLTGWVASANLSARRVISASSAVTPEEIALAGKGFSREVEAEYRKTGPDYSMVDEMEKIAVSAADLRQFIIQGRLAGGE